jgi:hypothetical protein
MSSSPQFYATQAKLAEEKLLGTKFCFSCQKDRPIATGKTTRKGNSSVWRCQMCASRATPSGFKKQKEAA